MVAGYAPTVDGVVLQKSIARHVAEGHLAPGVPTLAGSNLDEGTIFMMLTPRISCDASNATLRRWASDFYGPTVGAQVAARPRTWRTPTPCTSH